MNTESGYEIVHLTGDKALIKVREMLKHFRNAMMVTSANGFPHSRPMGLQGRAEDFDGTLWFLTDRTSRKVEEIKSNPSSSLVFQSDSESAFIHLFGRAWMADNRAKMEELYSPLLKTWFPKGLEDPRLTLIRFEADNGDFWASPGGILQVLTAFTKSVVAGKQGQGGEIGEVAFT